MESIINIILAFWYTLKWTASFKINNTSLTLSWRRSLSYRNQSTDLLCKSVDWFLYGNGLVMKELTKKEHFLLSIWYLHFRSDATNRSRELNFLSNVLCQSLFFNKIGSLRRLRPATLLKNRLRHRTVEMKLSSLKLFVA